MFTAQAIEQLPRLDLLALKHKPNTYSDEEWFEYTMAINGIPLDIYAGAREELEQEEVNDAIGEMNARIIRWFPRLVQFGKMNEVELDRIEKLLNKMHTFTRSKRFRKIPPDHPHRIELLDELDFFDQLANDHREEGYEVIRLNPSEDFLKRMKTIVNDARKG